ncbi:hypothetical protein MMC20_007735 [Loxospora ochrophaea]|nr:hypothetical protein [Loxospora ochrophaea]
MPPAKKRKRNAATTSSSSKKPKAEAISGFTKVSKPLAQHYSAKIVTDTIVLGDALAGSGADGELLQRKAKQQRKLGNDVTQQGCEKRGVSVDDNGDNDTQLNRTPIEDSNAATRSSPTSAPPSPSQLPQQSVKTLKKPPRRHLETPTKGARACLEAFVLHSSSPSTLKSSPPLSPSSSDTTPPSLLREQSSFPSPVAAAESLPEELQELLHLHSAFLTALSLHHAHHGSLAPVDLRVLNPGIERAWGKRRILIEDIRRTLAILQCRTRADGSCTDIPEKQSRHSLTSLPRFSLVDYGNNAICLETCTRAASSQGDNDNRALPIPALTAAFVSALRSLWRNRNPPTTTPQTLLSTFPLLPIHPSQSLVGLAPILNKGQRLLATFRFPKPTSAPTTPSKPAGASTLARSRSSDLITRIRAKESLQRSLPSPPTAEALARRAALQRLEEVVPVLEVLSNGVYRCSSNLGQWDGEREVGGGKTSFTMATLVQNLQMSMRNPIGREESERCVRALAEEVAPEWVEVASLGKVVGVTFRRGGVRKSEWRERIRGLLE